MKNFDIHDLLFFGGFVSLAVGLWWYNPALCLVVVGAVLMWLAISGARKGQSDGKK